MPTPQEIYAKAKADRLAARRWLAGYIRPGLPKAFTKDQLRAAAMRDLGVSKAAFNLAWDWVIDETGCQHWYEPLRGRRGTPT